MPLFQPSTKAVSAVCQEIADCVGASAVVEMTNRAFRSLNAGLQHFNNKAKWNFLLAEAAPQLVLAPFSITGITASGGAASAACPTGHGLAADDLVVGSGFANGTRVSATAVSGFGIYGLVTGFTGTAVVSGLFARDMYDLPSDFKAPYTFRLLTSQNTLRYVGRRMYDRSVTDEQTASTPYWYDLLMVGSRGKVRLLTPPTANDVLFTRYYRRMTVASASSDATVIDIPQDFEPYLIAWGKWHFLADKSDVSDTQFKTWFTLSQEGLQTMLREQTQIPDQDLMFVPGHFQFGNLGDNVTRYLDWTFSS